MEKPPISLEHVRVQQGSHSSEAPRSQPVAITVVVGALVSISFAFFAIFLLPLLLNPYQSPDQPPPFSVLIKKHQDLQQKLTRSQPSSLVQGRGACEAYLNADVSAPFSVVMTADPGDFSGTPEAHYILNNLQHMNKKPKGDSVCADVQQGILMGQDVVIVTSGIGAAAASLCTLELVSACGAWIKEIIYFGTSGWSPQLGGVLNPPDCDAANDNQKIVRTGDVCISPFSVNWVCKKSTWVQQSAGAPNQCSRPEEMTGPSNTPLFGRCMFYEDNLDANLELAIELLAGARSAQGAANQPKRSSHVSDHETAYWGEMGKATGATYPAIDPDQPPTVFDYKQCMEVDGQFFYSGVPWELKAREYAAMTLTAAMTMQAQRVSSVWGGRAAGPEPQVQVNFSAKDVIAVSAMEGVGIAEALMKYHSLYSTRYKIPYTNVRTTSNWLHPPVSQVKKGHWEVVPNETPEDFVHGYDFAIASGSSVILTFYQTRCYALDRTGHLLAGHKCEFNIDYTGN